ncbi:unnamed protein product [Sphenostylis stenocarpa]|uniref:Uncharacterized protein n=1 Tax=Sphenostylis stenocarpa TaxID=92480 RepID=A0AA86W122_9FABA|nr:unnamed protein product [Sphenostylis stenocarpa]
MCMCEPLPYKIRSGIPCASVDKLGKGDGNVDVEAKNVGFQCSEKAHCKFEVTKAAQQCALAGIPIEKFNHPFRIPEHTPSLSVSREHVVRGVTEVVLASAVNFVIGAFGVGGHFSHPDTSANNTAKLSATKTHTLGSHNFQCFDQIQ